MKKYIFILLLLFVAMMANAQVVSEKNAAVQCEIEEDDIFELADEMPVFPGGIDALVQYLSSNISYPLKAQEYGIEGKVILHFIVQGDGSISHVKVEKSASHVVEVQNEDTGIIERYDYGFDLDREAIRVVKAMPKWKAGSNNGKPIKALFHLPVTFRLD